jgi:Fe-S-cluster-containing dehydrogenase component/formate-dependent nitrite reductase membrane component NrfD
VACKTENHVPLGVNRTWVKYVEKGRFPHTRRVFQVTRCNHCEKPPCVEICPVGAMYRRADGIVDFDSTRCAGCKACMEACPYDAIYIDPERQTAAKCHLCAHRTEAGLEPACAAVCPEHAILAGDLDEPDSEIRQLVARETVRVRKPEKGTRPKLFYVDGEESAVEPTAARHEAFYMWSQRNESVQGGGARYEVDSPFLRADLLAAYDVSHARPWGWQVPVFLWLKSISAGLVAAPVMAMAFGWLPFEPARNALFAAAALASMIICSLLLVSELGRKARAADMLRSPLGRSWLSRGAWILLAYGILCGLVWMAAMAGRQMLSAILMGPAALSGLLAAAYSAFLFEQCKGRDLWQARLLPAHLAVQALLAGAAVLAWLPDTRGFGTKALAVCAGLHLLLTAGEVAARHGSDHRRYAARLMTRGPYRWLFWAGAVALGGVVPMLLASWIAGLSGLLALGGLLAFEWSFVMAGQGVANS